MNPSDRVDSETQVVGALLVEPFRIRTVARMLRAVDFSDPYHRAAFDVLTAMDRTGAPVDVVTVRHRLDQFELFRSSVDPTVYLAETGRALEYAPHAEHHAAEVARAAKKRRLYDVASNAAARALNGETPENIIADLWSGVEDLRRDATGGSRFRAITAAELDTSDFAVSWLVDWLLVVGQPCILAGGKKCLKTTLLVDLGISVATGGMFLGKFQVRDAKRFLLCSGESGVATLQETSRRVAAAKGWRLADVPNYAICEELPQLNSVDDSAAWQSFVETHGAEVAAIDPAYLCMPGDGADNLFKTGDLLANVARICRPLGITLIICHHTKKHRLGDLGTFDPPELEDIAWAGFQEFARQWLLVGRRERYVAGTGEHRLWLNYGGSTGHGGLLAIDVNEGVISDPGGRFYDVLLARPAEAIDSAEQRKTDAKLQRAAQQVAADHKAIVDALAAMPAEQGTKTDLRDRTSLNTRRFAPALASALQAGDIVSVTIAKANKQTYEGFKLCHPDSPGLSQ